MRSQLILHFIFSALFSTIISAGTSLLENLSTCSHDAIPAHHNLPCAIAPDRILLSSQIQTTTIPLLLLNNCVEQNITAEWQCPEISEQWLNVHINKNLSLNTFFLSFPQSQNLISIANGDEHWIAIRIRVRNNMDNTPQTIEHRAIIAALDQHTDRKEAILYEINGTLEPKPPQTQDSTHKERVTCFQPIKKTVDSNLESNKFILYYINQKPDACINIRQWLCNNRLPYAPIITNEQQIDIWEDRNQQTTRGRLIALKNLDCLNITEVWVNSLNGATAYMKHGIPTIKHVSWLSGLDQHSGNIQNPVLQPGYNNMGSYSSLFEGGNHCPILFIYQKSGNYSPDDNAQPVVDYISMGTSCAKARTAEIINQAGFQKVETNHNNYAWMNYQSSTSATYHNYDTATASGIKYELPQQNWNQIPQQSQEVQNTSVQVSTSSPPPFKTEKQGLVCNDPCYNESLVSSSSSTYKQTTSTPPQTTVPQTTVPQKPRTRKKTGEKPSYKSLIRDAIEQSDDKRLKLPGIYAAVSKRVHEVQNKRTSQQTKDKTRQNCIRHTLSLYNCFVKVDDDLKTKGSGMGDFWSYNASLEGTTQQQKGKSPKQEVSSAVQSSSTLPTRELSEARSTPGNEYSLWPQPEETSPTTDIVNRLWQYSDR